MGSHEVEPRRFWPRRAGSRGRAVDATQSGRAQLGQILAPGPGARVAGLVPVLVAPARTGEAVDLVRLEWSRGGDWIAGPEVDERTYELSLDEGAAIVRSYALAEALAALFETRLAPSTRRPWSAWRELELEWDSSSVPFGAAELRAVTVDAVGVEVATEPIEVVVVAVGEADPVEDAGETAGEQAAPGLADGEPAPRLQPRARRSCAVLEAAIDSHPELDPWRRESLETLLHYLTNYANSDGTLPARFDVLVDDEFGDLLDATW